MKRTEPPSANPPKPAGDTNTRDNLAGDAASPGVEKGVPPKAESIPLGLHLSGPEKSKPPQPETRAAGAGPVIPPILLEGDAPPPRTSGPGTKYATSSTPEPAATQSLSDELPEAYGTGRLLLAARDPHCLYAQWDFTAEQQRRYSELSSDQYLLLRVHETDRKGPLAAELRIHPDCHHSFIHTEASGGQYVAELGYYAPTGSWSAIATSAPAVLFSEPMKKEEPVKFATLTFPIPPPLTTESPKPDVMVSEPRPHAAAFPLSTHAVIPRSGVPFDVISQLQELGFPLVQRAEGVPFTPAETAEIGRMVPEFERLEGEEAFELISRPVPASVDPKQWTTAQEEALAEVVGSSLVRRGWPGSQEIAELVQVQARRAGVFGPAELLESSAPEIRSAVSSQVLGELSAPERAGFWLNVSAELVIYGATEPNASVAISGRPVHLRPDGTFSYRFALPDGSYRLAVTAVSPSGDMRQAELDFARGTVYKGEVGNHAQDPGLKAPGAHNLS